MSQFQISQTGQNNVIWLPALVPPSFGRILVWTYLSDPCWPRQVLLQPSHQWHLLVFFGNKCLWSDCTTWDFLSPSWGLFWAQLMLFQHCYTFWIGTLHTALKSRSSCSCTSRVYLESVSSVSGKVLRQCHIVFVFFPSQFVEFFASKEGFIKIIMNFYPKLWIDKL